jgi:PAS domain S-box-containing protein
MTRERRLPVMFVVAATLVTVTTLVLGAVGAANQISHSGDEYVRLRRVTAAQADELAVALALPVWNIDRPQIDKILDSQTGAMIVEAVVVNAAGNRHARERDARRRLVPVNGRLHTEGLLLEERPIVFGGETIASMALYTTPRFVRQSLRQSLISTLLTIVITDVILVLSIYLVLYRIVLRPLVDIERFAAAVSAGGGGSVPSVEAAGTKELEQLRSSIDTMVRTIKDEQDFTEKALNVVNEIFFVQDRTGHFIRWNRATADIFGIDSLNREPRFILRTQTHPDDRHLVLDRIHEIFDGGGYAEAEVRYVFPDGTRRMRLAGQRMEIGGEPYLVCTGVDVTEQRKSDAERVRLREAIQQSAIEWRQTFDSVSTPIVITDADGVIQRLNASAAKLADRPEAEVVGRNISEIAHGDDGRSWDISVNSLFADSDDSPKITVFWEITRIVALQESLRRSETMTAMGNLVGGVAHEVRNPLFGISATLDAYSEEMNTTELREMAATLRDQVGRLSRLMKELLEFGKPVAVTRRPGALHSLLDEVVASRRAPAQAEEVELRSHISHDVPLIPMDRDRLRQVFENVVDNALQHAPRGTAVTISGDALLHAGRHCVEIRIEDEGKGFLPGETRHVFEPFFTRRERGTGLGLSIVQKIVEEHEGSVTASNRAQGGARITIRLPA